MRFGTWNVRNLYRAGSLSTVVGDVARYESDLVDVQEVRWGKGGTVRTEDYIFLGKRNENHQLRTRLYVHHEIVSAVKRVVY